MQEKEILNKKELVDLLKKDPEFKDKLVDLLYPEILKKLPELLKKNPEFRDELFKVLRE